eukprot:PhF_6_TR42653/c0_g1_i7/m.64239/K00750/GYG1, GYG2; glycogenin
MKRVERFYLLLLLIVWVMVLVFTRLRFSCDESCEDTEDTTRRQNVEIESLRNEIRRIESMPLETQKSISSISIPTTGNTNPPYAYVMIISNEQYVDGAMVLGYTLRKHSDLLRRGECALVILITQNRVGEVSKQRLQRAGFTEIIEVVSLAKRVPNSYWKDTFDKLYMFNLTKYQKVVFMDSDMLVINPGMDKLFSKKIPSPKHVGAIGNPPVDGHYYFQTGMMVFQPSVELARDIFEEFESNIPPRNKSGKYVYGNARDGLLVRNYFQGRYFLIDDKYSRNTDPRRRLEELGAVALHFRGIIKPWYDRRKPNKNPELGKKEFGHNYVRWWSEYEEIHRASPDYIEDHGSNVGWGGTAAAPTVSGRRYVWMMRYSPLEYVQLLSEADIQSRNLTIPGLIATTCNAGESCTACCPRAHSGTVCVERALYFSWLNDCTTLRRMFPQCDECFLGIYSKQRPSNYHPGYDSDTGKCRYNYLHDDHTKPSCDAALNQTERLCPCVPLEKSSLEPLPL